MEEWPDRTISRGGVRLLLLDAWLMSHSLSTHSTVGFFSSRFIYYLQLRKIGPSWILGLWGPSTMESLRPKAIYGQYRALDAI